MRRLAILALCTLLTAADGTPQDTKRFWAKQYSTNMRFDPSLLGIVPSHEKNLDVEVEVASGAEAFRSYPEVLGQVRDFYAGHGIRISYRKAALDHDSVKVIILPEAEYVERNPPLPSPEFLVTPFLPPEVSPRVFPEPYHVPDDGWLDTIGTADFVGRTVDIRFQDADRDAAAEDRDLVVKHYVNVIKHEIGHLLSLAHTDLSQYDTIDDYVGHSHNMMCAGGPEYIVDCCTALTPLQVKQVHSFLGKGKVYDLIIEHGLLGYWGGMQDALRAKAMLR